MSRLSRMLGGILLIVLPRVTYPAVTLPHPSSGKFGRVSRNDLWRAGHAHAGVYLVLSLAMLRNVEEAVLPPFWKWLARAGAPIGCDINSGRVLLVRHISKADIGARFLAAAVLTKPRNWSHSRRRPHGTMRGAQKRSSSLIKFDLHAKDGTGRLRSDFRKKS